MTIIRQQQLALQEQQLQSALQLRQKQLALQARQLQSVHITSTNERYRQQLRKLQLVKSHFSINRKANVIEYGGYNNKSKARALCPTLVPEYIKESKEHEKKKTNSTILH